MWSSFVCCPLLVSSQAVQTLERGHWARLKPRQVPPLITVGTLYAKGFIRSNRHLLLRQSNKHWKRKNTDWKHCKAKWEDQQFFFRNSSIQLNLFFLLCFRRNFSKDDHHTHPHLWLMYVWEDTFPLNIWSYRWSLNSPDICKPCLVRIEFNTADYPENALTFLAPAVVFIFSMADNMGTRNWGLGGRDYVILMRQSLLLMLTVITTKKSARLQTDGLHFVTPGGSECILTVAASI